MAQLIARIGGPPEPIMTVDERAVARQRPQLGREMIEQHRLANVQTRKDMADDEIMRQALVKASDQAGDNHQQVPDLALRHFIAGGGSSKRAQAFIQFLDTHQQNLLKMKGEELTNAEKEHDQLAGLIGAVTQQKDPEMQSVAYRAMLPHLPPQLRQQLPADFDPQIVKSLEVQEALLKTRTAQFAEATKRAAQATAERQAAAHEMTAQATAAKSEAEIPGLKAEAEIKQKQAEAMRTMTPESIDAQVDAVLPQAKYADVNTRTKQLVHGAMSMGAKPETITALMKDAADQVGRTEGQLRTFEAERPYKQADIAARMAESRGRVENARADRSYQFHARELDAASKPVDDLSARLSRMQETLRQGSPAADALVAPELLSVVAGGQGSNLRMSEAEISRIIGGRSKWEELRAFGQKLSVNPALANSITPAQRQQIKALVEAVDSKVKAKQQALAKAREDLAASDNITEHRAIVNRARQEVTKIEQEAPAKVGTGDTIRVKRKSDGKVGSMPAANFDASKYDKL